MKKLIIACAAAGCLMLSGCAKKNPQPSPTPSAVPSEEPTTTPSATPETAEGLKGIMEAIRRNDEYQLPMSMDVDDTVLVDMYGLSSDLVKDYAIFMPAMNVHATEIILVEAQDGKLDEVKKALDKRMETVEQTWSTYLPAQYELVKNRKTLEEGNVIAIVIADQADAILQEITDRLNAAQNMVFSSLPFLFGYLPVVLVVMRCAPLHARNFCLFLVSLIFYGWSEPVYIVIMLISTLVDYYNGRRIDHYRDDRKKAKRFVWFSVIFNLSLLGFFKYADFFIYNLQALGLPLSPLHLSLPVGISFYTFQTMSYPIDVYRHQAPVQKSVISFGAYVTLFPQLIAGPIVRYKDIAKQLDHRTNTADQFVEGIQRFVCGLAKKVLLANAIGSLWDTISTLPVREMSVVGAWLGIAAFAFQIYFDFSGYSDMAIGLGKMLGFEFMENFNYPYISRSITEFWRRWHISLSTWFRDYVYIPLGGSRCGRGKQIRNLLIVWLLTGFWHGASWNFLFWGLYFGVLLILEKFVLKPVLDRLPAFLQHGYALILILLGWVLFAFTDLDSGLTYLKMMFGLGSVSLINARTLFYLRNYGLLFIIMTLASTPLGRRFYETKIRGQKGEGMVPLLILAGLVLCTAYLVDASYNPFLYFRF